jgi:hypothetical protein
MKRLLLRLVFPSRKALASWEKTRRGGLAKFVVINGVAWLGYVLMLLVLLDLIKVSALFGSLVHAVRDAPLKSTSVLLAIGICFGLVLSLINEFFYRIARDHAEP